MAYVESCKCDSSLVVMFYMLCSDNSLNCRRIQSRISERRFLVFRLVLCFGGKTVLADSFHFSVVLTRHRDPQSEICLTQSPPWDYYYYYYFFGGEMIRAWVSCRLQGIADQFFPDFLTEGGLWKQDSFSVTNPEVANIQKRLTHFIRSPLAQRWCHFEWFYSPIDAVLCKENTFEKCVDELGLVKVCLLSKKIN